MQIPHLDDPTPDYYDGPTIPSAPCIAGQHSGCRVVRCGCTCHQEAVAA